MSPEKKIFELKKKKKSLRMAHRLFRPGLMAGKCNIVTGGGSGIGRV